jgi:hypothetical protein
MVSLTYHVLMVKCFSDVHICTVGWTGVDYVMGVLCTKSWRASSTKVDNTTGEHYLCYLSYFWISQQPWKQHFEGLGKSWMLVQWGDDFRWHLWQPLLRSTRHQCLKVEGVFLFKRCRPIAVCKYQALNKVQFIWRLFWILCDTSEMHVGMKLFIRMCCLVMTIHWKSQNGFWSFSDLGWILLSRKYASLLAIVVCVHCVLRLMIDQMQSVLNFKVNLGFLADT